MPRGGKRTPSAGKKLGRPKQERVVDGNFARKLKAQIKAEKLWVFAAQQAFNKAKATGNSADLVRILMYLDDRDLGRPVDTVNHLHDKPLEVNMTVSLAEAIQKARKRAAEKHKNA